MSHAAAAALGAIAGATIFIGLPIGRVRGISRTVQGFLNALATGVLIFLLWDILTHAVDPIETALAAAHHGDRSFAALVAPDATMPSWGFLLPAGLVGGAPTFLGTVIGYVFSSPYIYVLFLALAAGALIYVVNEMFHIGRRLNSPAALAWGLVFGFLLAFATDLFLTYVAA